MREGSEQRTTLQVLGARRLARRSAACILFLLGRVAAAQTTDIFAGKYFCLPTTPDIQCFAPSPAGVAPGQSVSMILEVQTFAGQPAPAADVVLTDVLPPSLTFLGFSFLGLTSCTAPPVGQSGTIQCSFGTLPSPPASCGCSSSGRYIRAELMVTSATGPSTLITNTANATTSTPDTNPANNSTTAALLIAPAIPVLSSMPSIILALLLAALALLRLR